MSNKNIFEEAILTIKQMIAKEEKHIVFLKSSIERYKKLEWTLFGFKLFSHQKDIERLQGYIDDSNRLLAHYNIRLEEYQEAVKNFKG